MFREGQIRSDQPSATDDARKALWQLALRIKQEIEDGVAKGLLKPQQEPVMAWKVDQFQYGDTGVVQAGSHGENEIRESWVGASISVQNQVEKMPEFVLAERILHSVFPKKTQGTNPLKTFAGRLVWNFFLEYPPKEITIDRAIENFLKDLNEEPAVYRAKVEVHGIALRPEHVEIDFGLTLRQTRMEDLQKAIPQYGLHGASVMGPWPSAILNIQVLGRHTEELRNQIELVIAFLRLFKVGSVTWSYYQTESESIMDWSAGLGAFSGRREQALETSLIMNDDIIRLQKFWRLIGKSIPPSFYDVATPTTDHLTISYNRYGDALMLNGMIERRIANSIMGLEALFLKRGEVQELVYRLSARVSKMFALLGFDQFEVKKRIGDAYRVRNLFVHGSQLSYRERKSLSAKYQSLNELLLSVLDYLRTSLVVMVITKIGKEEFIDRLDDSLIDEKREQDLSQVLTHVRSAIS